MKLPAMDFLLTPGEENWARWIFFSRQEKRIGRDGFSSRARRRELVALDFLLATGEENWSRWIFFSRQEKRIGRVGFSSRGRRRKLIALDFLLAAGSQCEITINYEKNARFGTRRDPNTARGVRFGSSTICHRNVQVVRNAYG